MRYKYKITANQESPMPPETVAVRFTPVIGIVLALPGVASLVFGLWTLFLGSSQLTLLLSVLVFGVFLLVAGVVYLRTPYFQIEQKAAGGRTVLSGFGRSGRLAAGVSANRRQRFVIEEGRLMHMAEDRTRTPAPVRRWMAHPKDWRALEAVLGTDLSRKPSSGSPEHDSP